MQYWLLTIMISLSFSSAYGNDGAYFARGNQLIPMSETEIAIRKEILSLKRVNDKYLEVTVYYEFFNPKEAKNILVGFEAGAPSGDVEGAPKNGNHPYMQDFTVNLNNEILAYKVAYVSDTLYYKNGKIKSIDLNGFNGNSSGNNIDFNYVYYFNAHFKKGLNIIKHTYTFDLSGSVDYYYFFDYVLTAATRWANKQIDDFTLIVDNGEFETFCINKTFFNKANEWIINGIGKSSVVKAQRNSFTEIDAVMFHVQKGNLIFQKTNFKPKGELELYSQYYVGSDDLSILPFSYHQQANIPEPQGKEQIRILKNLPFARRGYVFKNAVLKEYFEKMDWYIPNPNYIPDLENLNDLEKKWLGKWK